MASGLDPKIEDKLWYAYENAWCSDGLALQDYIADALNAITTLKGMVVQKDERIRQLEKERDHARDMYSRARYPDMTGS